MSPDTVASPGEFRRYRRFVSLFILSFVSIGSTYLLISVGVTIYRRQHAVPLGSPIGAVASIEELESCYEELSDVTLGLERHLENFHNLVAHYDFDEAQRWGDDRMFWLGQWRAAGDRCHFDKPRAGKTGKHWSELAVVHADLRDIESRYHQELSRFSKEQAPAMDRIRDRLDKISKQLTAEQDSSDVADARPSQQSEPGERHE
ncbi:MAG TPA: hypothetical protein VNO55_24700 [Polyangia bacterium]|jgi:hypothetical protein|nr:hypothetical protein [Polyangia bacterium]